MTKTLISLGVWALLLVAPRATNADVSVDFFYNNLSGGSWVDVADYGYCWQPDVAVGNSDWRPYADGYWAYTDLGWTWVSYEDFGWATYHYGRWAMLSDYGWVWVPGRDADLEWGPAWVSWRTGGDYVGWAPLPPETITVVEGRPLSGHLDVEFNIGPAYYNFVDVRYIGEPVLRERIIASTQNVTYIQQTVNVTNITYKNKTVYNYGPDINVINRSAARPIQRLRLEREQNVDVAAAAKSGGLTKVQGDRLLVAAPMHVSRSARQVAPPAVKAKVAAAKIDRGWSGVGDEKAQAEFKERIKTQNLKNVPPPTSAGSAAQANVAASASPGAGVGTGTSTEANQGRGQGRRGGQAVAGAAATGSSPAIQGSPAGNATTDAAATEAQGGRYGQGKHNRFPQAADQNPPGAPPAEAGAASPSVGGGAETGVSQGGPGGHHGRRGQDVENPPGSNAAPNPSGATADQSQQRPGEARRDLRREMRNNPGGQNVGPGQGGGGQGHQGGHLQSQPGQAAPGEVQGQAAGGHHQHGQAQGGGQGAQGEQPQGQGHHGGKKGQGEGSPAPTPQ